MCSLGLCFLLRRTVWIGFFAGSSAEPHTYETLSRSVEPGPLFWVRPAPPGTRLWVLLHVSICQIKREDKKKNRNVSNRNTLFWFCLWKSEFVLFPRLFCSVCASLKRFACVCDDPWAWSWEIEDVSFHSNLHFACCSIAFAIGSMYWSTFPGQKENDVTLTDRFRGDRAVFSKITIVNRVVRNRWWAIHCSSESCKAHKRIKQKTFCF